MGVIETRLAMRRAKAVGDPGNDFGGVATSILGAGSSVNARSTAQLLAATASSTWAHVATTLKSIRIAGTHWTLLRAAGRGLGSDGRPGREFRVHQRRLGDPVATGKDVAERVAYIKSLKESGYLVEQVDHPFLRMLDQGTMWSDNPNIHLGGYEVARLFSATVESVGQWFCALIRDEATGVPVRWLPLPPHWVQTPSGRAQPNYEIPKLGMFGSRAVPPWDMASYRIADPEEPYERGKGDLNATDVEIRADELASTHMAARLQNHGVPLLLLMLAGITDPEKKELEHEWRRDLTGPLKSGMAKFLKVPEGLDLSAAVLLKELQSSPVDLDIGAQRGYNRDAILMGGRVPPLAAGEQRSGNRAMALVAEKLIDLNAITPAREGARDWYRSRFFAPVGSRPAEYGEGWIVMWEAPEKTDEDSRDRMMAQVPEHFSRAHFLRVAGAQPRPGDENIYFMPSNKVLYDGTTNQPIFTPPQPAGRLPFGANTEPSFTKLEDQVVALAQLVDRLEFGAAEQGV